jgi:hypothetical protein
MELRKRDLGKLGITALGTVALADTAGGQEFTEDTTVAKEGAHETGVLLGPEGQRSEIDASATCSLIYEAPVAGERYYSPLGIEGWHLAAELEVSQGRLRLVEQSSIPQTGLRNYYNPDEITASTGSAVSTFPDSEGSLDLSGGDPIYEADAMESVDAPVYDATDDKLQAANASDWTVLHDGSEFEMFLAFQPDSNTMSDEFGEVAGTMSFTKYDRGFIVGLDDRNEKNYDKKLVVGVGNGGGSWVLDFVSSDKVLNYDEPNIVNVRFDGVDTYVVGHNDTELTTVTASGHDSSNPEGAYAHGETPGSFSTRFGGAIGDNLIYDSVLSSSDRSSAWSSLASKYGVTL